VAHDSIDFISFRRESSGPSEVFGEDGKPFSHYGPVLEEMGRMGPGEWGRRVNLAHERLLGVQRDLGIPDREDKTYPTDYVPRLLPAVGWEVLEEELAYGMTKGAIEAFTRSLAAGVGHRGITVNAVNPGPTDTGWMTEELRRELLPKFPPGRIGYPEDAARLVAFLAGDEAAWITGQTIHSEGGFVRK
jgi:NAD(P)-dependent dehydrogenase (short-subunit alcohol dehydrogenase family)